jgi:uroporphyrinogen-III synthase
MRALITRPAEDAAPIATALATRGFATMIEPMMTIVPLETPLPALDAVQAILLTSRNGVRALAAAGPRRDLPVFAVGESTAALARDAGFDSVVSAGGDGGALARLVIERLRAADGALLHATGRDGTGELAARLTAAGFVVAGVALYEARPVAAFSATLRAGLAAGEIDMVLFFSPRTGRIFVSLAKQAGVDAVCAAVGAACLSPAVAEALAPLRWRALAVAGRPDTGSLLAAVDGLRVQLSSEG